MQTIERTEGLDVDNAVDAVIADVLTNDLSELEPEDADQASELITRIKAKAMAAGVDPVEVAFAVGYRD